MLEGQARLVLAVKDNGRGMSPERLEEITACLRGSSQPHLEEIGLYNVLARLRLQYGSGAEMRLKNNEDGLGLTVTLIIPLEETGG